VASYGYTREYHEYMRERPIIPGRGTVLGRAVTECKPIQVNDVEADPEYTLREGQRLGGFRTVLGIPLLREGVPIGVIVLTRNTVAIQDRNSGSFSDHPISTPIRRLPSACCARAASGHTAAPPTRVMKSRRLMSAHHYSIILFAPTSTNSGNVRLSSLAVRKLMLS
jgi:GAF domain